MAFRINQLDAAFWAPALALVYRLWEATLRYRVDNWETVAAARAQGRNVVLAHWHDETFSLPYLRTMPGHAFVAIVSQSRDGEIMAQLLQRLGLITARGSKSRGGVKALIQARRTMLEQGRIGVVTVDGPRGPRHKVKEGAIYLAYKTDALLVPVRIAYSRARVFTRAWDRFQLPWPGSRCHLLLGDAYALESGELNAERLACEMQRLEERLHALAPGRATR